MCFEAPSTFSIGLMGFTKSTSGASVEHRIKPITPLHAKQGAGKTDSVNSVKLVIRD